MWSNFNHPSDSWRRFWHPTLTSHDPNPLFSLEDASPVAPPSSGTVYYGVLKRWTGASWVKEPLKVYLAGTWQSKPLKRYASDLTWKLIDTTGV